MSDRLETSYYWHYISCTKTRVQHYTKTNILNLMDYGSKGGHKKYYYILCETWLISLKQASVTLAFVGYVVAGWLFCNGHLLWIFFFLVGVVWLPVIAGWMHTEFPFHSLHPPIPIHTQVQYSLLVPKQIHTSHLFCHSLWSKCSESYSSVFLFQPQINLIFYVCCVALTYWELALL